MSSMIKSDAKVKLLVDVQLFLDVDTLTSYTFLFSTFTHILLAKHLLRCIFHFGKRVDLMETTDETIFLKVARSATTALDLRLYKKGARLVIRAERSRHIECLLWRESHMSSWYGHSVSVHHLDRLIFVQAHVSYRIA